MNQKINNLALGYSLSLLSAICMILLGIAGSLGIYVGAVEMMQKWHLFFSPTILGTITGAIEGAVWGFVSGWLIAFFYNKFL